MLLGAVVGTVQGGEHFSECLRDPQPMHSLDLIIDSLPALVAVRDHEEVRKTQAQVELRSV